jgi:hypothetical protein
MTHSRHRISSNSKFEPLRLIRPHSSLKAHTPDQVYFNRLLVPLAA